MKLKFLLISFFLCFVSCNYQLEKRLYNKGYYVRINGKNKLRDKSMVSLKNNVVKSQAIETSKPVDIFPGQVVADILKQHDFTKSEKDFPLWAFAEPVDRKSQAFNTNSQREKLNYRVFTFKSGTAFYSFIDKSEKKKNKDSFFYALAGLTTLGFYAFMRKKQSFVLKLTRWANKNKSKSQTLIAYSKIGLAILGVATGKKLHEMGYTFSDSFNYAFGILMTLGFLGLLKNSKAGDLTLMNEFYLKKLSAMAIGLSFFMISAGIGNSLAEGKSQNTPMGYVIQKISSNNVSTNNAQPEISDNSLKTKGQDSNAGLVVLYVILAILLVAVLAILTCVAACSGGAAVGIPVLLASIVIIILVIVSMVNSIENAGPKLTK